MRIGILALQGAFAEHASMLRVLDTDSFEIRQRCDINRQFDGLILPGGESTVMGKLLRELELFEPLRCMINDGLPVFGTCAGLLLLADAIEGESIRGFGTMRMTARRNAYGRQLGSFCTEAHFGDMGVIPMTFIRAPFIASVSGCVETLATVDGKIVAARQGNQLVTAFHPELNRNLTVHRYFLDNMILGQ